MPVSSEIDREKTLNVSIKYRKDIDGLRALAVIPVVLFHAGIPYLSGGYVGVDVFFVISGYLITTILMKELSQDSFSIATFYERRIKRIFPALFTVLIVSGVTAYWVMLPGEFNKFKQSVLSTLFFYSNYHFMIDVGYFADHAETKPLLHTWSLAVEEQFYVIFPIYLLLAYKYFRRYLVKVTVLLLVISMVYSEILVRFLPADAFYSTPARAWELMVGSMLAIHPKMMVVKHTKWANFLSFFGLMLILYSVVFFNKATSFPGSAALLPVLGTAMIIASAHAKGNWVGVLLSSSVFRFIGLISYSLYLWHWPVLTFARLYSLGSHPHEIMPFLLALMVVLAYLSWRFVETPFRKANLFSIDSKWKINQFSSFLMISFAVMALVSFSEFNKKIPQKYKSHMEKRDDYKPIKLEKCDHYKASERGLMLCMFGDTKVENASFVLLGDSHGYALLPGLEKSAQKYHKKGYYVGSGGCLSLFGVERVKQGFDHCVTRMKALSEYLGDHPSIKKVILASRWATYSTGKQYKDTLGDDFYIRDKLTDKLSFIENKKVFERGFERTVSLLKKLGIEIVVITQVPESEYGGLDITRAKMLGKTIEFRPVLSEYMERQKIAFDTFSQFNKNGDIQLLNLHEHMCQDTWCDVFDSGKSIYIDNNHISRTYALKIADLYDWIFSD